MIDSMLNLLFRCPHRRLTRPITPVSKPGAVSLQGPGRDTYVVCLDCGKQFAYDWTRMRISHPVESTPTSGVLDPKMPKPRGEKLKWGLLASIPLVMLVGKALGSKKGKPPSD